jgi:hypothetical protein
MARETWKCPYADCKQECSRKGNLQRHIIRRHGGEGKPVKNKSTVDTEKSILDIQYTGNIFKNQYASHPNSSYSLPSQYSPSTIKGFYSRSQIAKEEKKGQEVKMTDELLDPVDIVYQKFKKYKDRNDKIEEMINYFANNNSRIPHFPLVFNYDGKLNNMPPYDIWSEFSSTSIPSASSTSQVKSGMEPKTVIGYVGYICRYCLESEPVQMMYDPNASNEISWTQHICDPETLNSAREYPAFIREDVCMYRVLDLPEQMIKAVKEWTKDGGEVFLVSDKITSGDIPKNTVTVDIHKDQYIWLTRAIFQKYTILDDIELKEFFTLIIEWCSTFCCLCINFVEKEGQQNMKQEYYYLFLNYKPCLPWRIKTECT